MDLFEVINELTEKAVKKYKLDGVRVEKGKMPSGKDKIDRIMPIYLDDECLGDHKTDITAVVTEEHIADPDFETDYEKGLIIHYYKNKVRKSDFIRKLKECDISLEDLKREEYLLRDAAALFSMHDMDNKFFKIMALKDKNDPFWDPKNLEEA